MLFFTVARRANPRYSTWVHVATRYSTRTQTEKRSEVIENRENRYSSRQTNTQIERQTEVKVGQRMLTHFR